jgi:hypothetical protein
VAHERRPALAHGTYIPSPVPASVAAGRDGRGWTVEQLASCFPRTFPPTRSSVPDDTRLTCIRPFIRPPPVHTRRRVHFFFFLAEASRRAPPPKKQPITIHQHDGHDREAAPPPLPRTKRKVGYDTVATSPRERGYGDVGACNGPIRDVIFCRTGGQAKAPRPGPVRGLSLCIHACEVGDTSRSSGSSSRSRWRCMVERKGTFHPHQISFK